MTMYNMMFGSNSDAKTILETIGLKEDDFYRYRDCFIEDDGTIAVYTRGGGGNRECWESEACANGEHSPTCVETIQPRLRSHPNYINDEDDDFDCTYSTFRFKPANEIAIKEFQNGVRGEALWPLLFEALEKP